MLIKLTADIVPLFNYVKMETLIWAVTHATYFCSKALRKINRCLGQQGKGEHHRLLSPSYHVLAQLVTHQVRNWVIVSSSPRLGKRLSG